MTAPGAPRPEFRFRPTGRVLKQADAALYADAARYLDEARRHHDEVMRGLADEVEAARARGYREGLAQGEQAAARLLVEASAGAQRLVDGLEAELCRIALRAVASVLGDLDVADAVARAVRLAIDERRDADDLVVRVHPEMRDRLVERLGALLGESGGEPGRVRVEADGELAPGDCILVTSAGYVRCGIDDQFAVVAAALAERRATGGRP